MTDKIVRKHILVYGRVQGVGFRYRASHAARSFGLTGWVRNNPDGTVEMELQGEDIDIAFNSKYIMDVIRNVEDDDLYMNFNSNVSPCVVTSPKDQEYLYLILPVRVFQ